MTECAIALCAILVCLAIGQAAFTWRFLAALQQTRPSPPEGASSPKTAVILCLRGQDPYLARCIEAILQQDYPLYDVRIVVDSRDDPAWAIAERVVSQRGAANVRISALIDRRQTCSLKCSSLVQAISELDSSYEVVALLDADTIPHRGWLRELVAPLADDRVAVATGNRWYAPASLTWGSLVRQLWNMAAVVEMHLFCIPWGGTLAIKMNLVRQSGLLQRWANALCEDAMLCGLVQRLGYRIAFVPSLMMVNRESCTLTDFVRWVRRQLLLVRLYHPAWPVVAGHGLVLGAVQLMSVVCLAATICLRDGYATAWLAAGVGVFWAIMAWLRATMNRTVRRVVAIRGEPVAWSGAMSFARGLAAMLLTQAVYSATLISSLWMRTVEWRGIRYRVDGPEAIRMVEYKPYASRPESESHPHSL